jgi:hypothetical protein
MLLVERLTRTTNGPFYHAQIADVDTFLAVGANLSTARVT